MDFDEKKGDADLILRMEDKERIYDLAWGDFPCCGEGTHPFRKTKGTKNLVLRCAQREIIMENTGIS